MGNNQKRTKTVVSMETGREQNRKGEVETQRWFWERNHLLISILFMIKKHFLFFFFASWDADWLLVKKAKRCQRE